MGNFFVKLLFQQSNNNNEEILIDNNIIETVSDSSVENENTQGESETPELPLLDKSKQEVKSFFCNNKSTIESNIPTNVGPRRAITTAVIVSFSEW